MGEKGRLDRAVEIEIEANVAELAVPLGADLVEASRLLRGRQAARANEPPPELEEPHRHGAQERAKDRAALLAPLVGERERPDAHDVGVGGVAHECADALGQRGGHAALAQGPDGRVDLRAIGR